LPIFLIVGFLTRRSIPS